jgi:hypothetical protein
MPKLTKLLLVVAVLTVGLCAYGQTYFGDAGIAVKEGTLFTRTAAGVDTAVSVNASTLNNLVAGTSSGMKVVGGMTTVVTSATITTGLTTVVSGTANLGQSATIDANDVTTTATGGSLDIYVWKPTSTGNPTPVAATVGKTVLWFAYGS